MNTILFTPSKQFVKNVESSKQYMLDPKYVLNDYLAEIVWNSKENNESNEDINLKLKKQLDAIKVKTSKKQIGEFVTFCLESDKVTFANVNVNQYLKSTPSHITSIGNAVRFFYSIKNNQNKSPFMCENIWC